MLLKSKSARIAAGVVGFAMALSAVTPAFAATSAELQAQLTALLAQVAALQAQLGTTGGSAQGSAVQFNTNLTVGSTGADVTALQQFLVSKGFLQMPANVSYGYFGSLTKSAVAAWQAANGISPAVGYFGPISRAAIASMGSGSGTPVVTPTAGCPTGAMYNSMTGALCSTTTPPSNNGVGTEGSFTVTKAAQPANDTNVTKSVDVPVFGVDIKASNSDMTIDRADIQMGITVGSPAVTINPASFVTSISAWDGSTRLMTMPLSSSDFTKDAKNNYYVRMTGIGFKVPKDTTKTLTFTVNTAGVSTVDSARVLAIKGYGTQGIRGVDTLGLNTYADISGITGSFTFNASNNATLTGSANSSATPKAQTIAVNTTDGVRGVTMEAFDLKSTVGDSTLTDLRAYVETNGVSTAAPTALYLYDGSTLLGSASVSVTNGEGTVDFSNLSLAIGKDVTKTLTLKADFPSTAVGTASTTIKTSSTESNTTMFDKADGTSAEVTIASAITGNDVHLYADSAPIWTLSSASASGTAGVVSVASSSVTGTITLNVKANGGTLTKPVAGNFDIYFASTTQLTTNGGSGYDATNGIQVTPSVTVTPNDATIGDGSSYTVTVTGTIYSNNTSFGSSQPLFMAINSIDSTIGGHTITDQNWGIDTFYTNSVQLTKGTQ